MENTSTSSYGVVLVTAASMEEAEAIASSLVEARMAACVSITPVRSIYTWEGKTNSDQEWQLVIKTDLSLFDQLTAKIQELHSYEVPEIIALPIIGLFRTYYAKLLVKTAPNPVIP